MSYTVGNTTCETWFERDRAWICLKDKKTDLEIVNMWDETVFQFVDDGYKSWRQTWHEALIDYCNELKVVF